MLVEACSEDADVLAVQGEIRVLADATDTGFSFPSPVQIVTKENARTDLFSGYCYDTRSAGPPSQDMVEFELVRGLPNSTDEGLRSVTALRNDRNGEVTERADAQLGVRAFVDSGASGCLRVMRTDSRVVVDVDCALSADNGAEARMTGRLEWIGCGSR